MPKRKDLRHRRRAKDRQNMNWKAAGKEHGKMTRREVTVSNTSNRLDSIKAAASNTSDDLGRCCIKYKQWVVGDVSCR